MRYKQKKKKSEYVAVSICLSGSLFASLLSEQAFGGGKKFGNGTWRHQLGLRYKNERLT